MELIVPRPIEVAGATPAARRTIFHHAMTGNWRPWVSMLLVPLLAAPIALSSTDV
ncbi:MAG: hypothetical protein ACRD1L_08235 [Terriglobales bacterium]